MIKPSLLGVRSLGHISLSSLQVWSSRYIESWRGKEWGHYGHPRPFPPLPAPRTHITMTSAGPASSSFWCPSVPQWSSCSTCCLPATATYCTRPLPTLAAGRKWTQRCAPTCCSTRELPCPSLPNLNPPGQCLESPTSLLTNAFIQSAKGYWACLVC